MEYFRAFLVGGLICLIGQALMDYTKLTPARILTGFVVAGVVLSAVGLYAPIAEFGGAGASVPIVGFGHLLFEGVKKSIETDGFVGVIKGGLIAASGGVTMSLFMGRLMSLFFKSKDQS